MELIVINESKVKIMLTPPDMRRYQVAVAASSPAPGPGLRRLLRDIREECGMELCEERLMVDLYTSESGCELFLTRLGPRGDIPVVTPRKTGISPCDATVSEPCETVAPPQVKNGKFPENSLTAAESALLDRIRAMDDELHEEVLIFADVHDLLRLCRRLSAVGFAGASAVYIESDSAYSHGHTTWYLWLTFPPAYERKATYRDRYAFLCEYAPTADIDHARICRGEYWKPIVTEEAVSLLGALA